MPSTPIPSSLRDALHRHGVHDPRVLAAIERVPRAAFLPPELAPHAHEDRAFPLSDGGTLEAPSVVARLLEALDVSPGQRVLEVGTGAGYATAVLLALGARIDAFEPAPMFARATNERLTRLGLGLVVRVGDASDPAVRGRGPWDRVLVSRPVDVFPESLLDAIAVGGHLVAAVAPNALGARLERVRRRDADDFVREDVGEVHFATSIGDILVAMGAAERAAVERAAGSGEGQLGHALLERGLVTEPDLFRALAFQRGLRFGAADELLPSMDFSLARAIPRAFLEHHRVVPIRREGPRVEVATTDPTANAADVMKACRCTQLEVVLVTPTDYRRLRTALELGTRPHAASEPERKVGDDMLAAREVVEDEHLVALLEAILLEAVGQRASDVHLERYGERVRLRLRVDGDLRDVAHLRMSAKELAGVVNVLKVASDLDISERRLPQGGRFRRRAGDQVFDLRVQTQPSLHGEHVVVRLLPQTQQLLTIESLGFPEAIAAPYRRLLDNPSGLVLVVGPTGSGKSTTLYAGLQILARDATRKVITVEDPIEYSIENVQQTQVRPEIGFAFADAMRAFVREDPDVILVGEIRDGETALEAIRASQTGHVVLSTLHSNDAVDAVQRLLDLGMHPNSIASELLAVIAQRLAKRICPRCKVPATPDPAIVAELFPAGPPPDFRCFVGRGCDHCQGHGTRGRIAAVELLQVGPEVRRAIARRLPVDDLRTVALASGLRTMRTSVLALVRDGIVPLGEVRSLLPMERMTEETS